MKASDTGPSMHPGNRKRRLIPPAPPSMDAGNGSVVAWINLTTCLLRFPSFGRGALHASVTRKATSYGIHPQQVSIQPSGAKAAEADPRPSRGAFGAGTVRMDRIDAEGRSGTARFLGNTAHRLGHQNEARLPERIRTGDFP